MATKLIETTVTPDAITLSIANVGNVVLPLANLSDDIRHAAFIHGLRQKISDAAALPKSELTGDASRDGAIKLAAMQIVVDRLIAGDWSARNSDGSGPVAGIIYRAFERWVLEQATAAKKPAPLPEDIRGMYDRRDRAGQLALKTIPRIAEIMDELRAEKPVKTPSVDADSLLAELGIA